MQAGCTHSRKRLARKDWSSKMAEENANKAPRVINKSGTLKMDDKE